MASGERTVDDRARTEVALAARPTARESRVRISPIPLSIDYGTVAVSAGKSVRQTLMNTGKADLRISRIMALGKDFTFSDVNLPLTLGPGESVTFFVTYLPTSPGISRGYLWVESNASKPWVAVRLTGTGRMPGQLRLSSPAMNFGNAVVGTTKKQVVMLGAVEGTVTVASGYINNAEFALEGISFPITIPPGRKFPMILTFRPESPGTSTGMLTLTTSATNAATHVPVAGKGIPRLEHWVTLGWDASTSNDVIGYNVYRGTQSGGPYSRINSTVDSATSAIDNSVFGGRTYYYVVSAINTDGQESSYSNETKAVIPSP